MSPRITGYRERYTNLYDSLDLSEMHGSNRLFGSANIGNLSRCNLQVPGALNLQVPGALGYDETFVILNVYVRTNISRVPISAETQKVVRDAYLEGRDELATEILLENLQPESPLAKAFNELAHVTTMTLVIGDKTSFEMNVFDLLNGPALGPGERPDGPMALDEDGVEVPLPWRRQLGRPLVVPVRQNVHVNLSTGSGMANDALQEQLPAARILPAPLLWVHLEGLRTRCVA